jgi:hypothetical protein
MQKEAIRRKKSIRGTTDLFQEIWLQTDLFQASRHRVSLAREPDTASWSNLQRSWTFRPPRMRLLSYLETLGSSDPVRRHQIPLARIPQPHSCETSKPYRIFLQLYACRLISLLKASGYLIYFHV